MKKGKHAKQRKKSIIQILCLIIFIISIVLLVVYFNKSNKEKEESQEVLENIEIDTTQITEEKTERMIQLEELQKENKEVVGYLEIDGTKISYPVCQTTNNDYYLTHNHKKEKASAGSLFIDKDVDLTNGSSNYLIYGHRSTRGLMFEDLIKYANEEFYKAHPTIRFTTLKEDATYEIMAVFYSRVYYKSEKNVFRYYYFINAENEEEYNNYVNNAKKVSIYNTGVTASYGDQLITLSTCEYSQEDGRFAIVAKKK